MLYSMTGFGTGAAADSRYRVKAEIKSVNRRFLDLSFNIPRQLMHLESRIKTVIKSSVKRGALSVYVAVDGEEITAPKIETNWAIVDEYIKAAEEIGKRSGGQTWDMRDLLLLPDVFIVKEASDLSPAVDSLVIEAVEKALSKLLSMRKAEGEQIYQDLIGRLASIERLVGKIADFAPEVRNFYEERLRKHVEEFLRGQPAIDEQRLLNEAAIFADKSNIDEELTRLGSHLKQCRSLLGKPEPKGRQLDFLIQEMNREINTIGSKGNNGDISRLVVAVKSEIEKLREQIQNVE